MAKLKKSKKKQKKASSEKDTKKKEKDNKKDNKKKEKGKKEKKVKNKKKHGIFSFLKSVKSEVSKVKWPSKKDMVKYSAATLSFILFFSLFFYVIDLLFALLKTGV